MKNIALLLFLFTALSSFAQLTKEQKKMIAEDKKKVLKMKGERFPDFTFKTLKGETISSENTKGKVVLFNFWFTTCKPCIMELPELNELVKEFEDENVVFVAPSISTEEQIDKFSKRFDFDYQQIANVKPWIYSQDIHEFPTHMIVNQEGIIEKVFIGYSIMTVGAIKSATKKLLK